MRRTSDGTSGRLPPAGREKAGNMYLLWFVGSGKWDLERAALENWPSGQWKDNVDVPLEMVTGCE